MTHDLTPEELERILEALRHLAAYRKATDRDERPYLEIAEKLQQPRKGAGKEGTRADSRRKRA